MSPGAPLKEVGLIALLAIALFTVLALFSYSPIDPAWSLRGTGLSVNNLVGRSGAWVADILLSLFGVMGYVVPLALVFAGLRTMRLVAWDWPLASLRIAGWLIGMLCGAVLARLHIARRWVCRPDPGGMVGSWLVQVGMPMLNWVGLTLLALVGLFTGAQTAIGFSWIGSCGAHRRLDPPPGRSVDALYRLLARSIRSNVATRREAMQRNEQPSRSRPRNATAPTGREEAARNSSVAVDQRKARRQAAPAAAVRNQQLRRVA